MHPFVFGQINLGPNNEFAGFVNLNVPVEDSNADIYYLTYNFKSWKTFCSPSSTEGTYDYFRTGGNSAACGVTLATGWYILGSSDSSVMPGFKSVESCGVVIPWSAFNNAEFNVLENLLPPPCPPPPSTETPVPLPSVSNSSQP